MNNKINIIKPKSSLWDINIKEIWNYKDLLFLFVKRDFVSTYKQTILGPLWFFIEPIFTTFIFTIIFGKLASIPTDGIPPLLFYMCGITCWNYFSECLKKTSNTFVENASIFGKVYFPRIIQPISVIISSLIKLSIQLFLFLLFLGFYMHMNVVKPNIYVLAFPILVILMGGLGLSFGIIISSLTTKYRDMRFLVVFGIQLFMYATPVVYPLSLARTQLGSYSWIAVANPMTGIIEAMKYAFLGQGIFNWFYLLYSSIFMIVFLSIGILIFNKVEQNFMDTV